MSGSSVRIFTQADFDRFAELSGDDNPIHVDFEYSAEAAFGRPVAHGMFLYSCLCAVISRAFPGAVMERQDLMFPAPTFTGEPVTVRAQVASVDGRRAVVETTVTRADGTVTATGEAVLRMEAL